MRNANSRSVQFLSTPSARRATSSAEPGRWHTEFLSTPSARRATVRGCAHLAHPHISIHALREEGDLNDVFLLLLLLQFLSTPSARRATNSLTSFKQPKDISIHALREEGD